MIIASIDIQNGKVVQLRQGKDLVLERDDAPSCAREFDVFGEIAVIDLDAARGSGSNETLVHSLLRKGECRVGGGIRTVEHAAHLVSLGAVKVIIGSSAFTQIDGRYAVNGEFLEALAHRIGRERLIVAVDARDGIIVVDGWQTSTGLPLAQTAQALEKYAGELLWTCVEHEGTLSGIDMAAAKELRTAVDCRITAAGGVSTLAEIEALSALGCDVQLGMALYTGKITLADAFIASLDWKKTDGLVPVIAQARDGQVLMTAYADKEAVLQSFARGKLCFHSRRRDCLWMKGEHSGNVLRLLRLRADCDHDALLATVEPAGPVCHTGAWSCFETGRRYTLDYLQSVISERLQNAPAGSYTASLTSERVRRKIMEEAYEVCTARGTDEVIWEAADLFYHTAVLLAKEGVPVCDVLGELDRRHKK
ncbi:MAG: bifunctional phosphoribosyl-AMP cyclohydrolase/phosphoribosyl-ATP diphosphatase HisIE [Spirochaetaceae bacterium]|jgi:phosphoribosyl-ATP pyrophosphohydrolase/phosphoribosyl-AMP cyclohydrolase|nr:bifunctional phosphoribosyl-AMP cyclohydrolase/phosphoribosyl-ATP diphosphatase HisIE [Spirochaetaceae bacterium]